MFVGETNKQKAIEILLIELRVGLSYSDCLSKYVENWRIAIRQYCTNSRQLSLVERIKT